MLARVAAFVGLASLTFLYATLTSCASPEQGGGKIGSDYWGSGNYQGARTQQMHRDIHRGNF